MASDMIMAGRSIQDGESGNGREMPDEPREDSSRTRHWVAPPPQSSGSWHQEVFNLAITWDVAVVIVG